MKCQQCDKEFEPGKYQKTRKYCSRSCVTAHRNQVCTIKDSWKKKYGDEWEIRYDEWRKKMSEVTSGKNNPMYGRHDHTNGLKNYAKEKSGKTYEEIHGKEKANKLRSNLSLKLSGENNPAYGKVYFNGGKSVKGYYKGLFFRSLLEYSFMKHLESQMLNLCKDVDYECFAFPYVFEGRNRTYRCDFYVKKWNQVFEVKPAYVLKNLPLIQQAKWNAASELLKKQNIEFKVVTERDFKKIKFDDARNDLDVVWKEETFKYFRKS